MPLRISWPWTVQVGYLEAVDKMVGQLLRRLWQAEVQGDGGGSSGGRAPGRRYSVLVTADHSTPVLFGDHSHEPVPLAIAHVRHVALAVPGGPQALLQVPLGPIPHPVAGELSLQVQEAAAAARERRRDEIERGRLAMGDAVCEFDEVAAAGGALGRFPGSEVCIKRWKVRGMHDV